MKNLKMISLLTIPLLLCLQLNIISVSGVSMLAIEDFESEYLGDTGDILHITANVTIRKAVKLTFQVFGDLVKQWNITWETNLTSLRLGEKTPVSLSIQIPENAFNRNDYGTVWLVIANDTVNHIIDVFSPYCYITVNNGQPYTENRTTYNHEGMIYADNSYRDLYAPYRPFNTTISYNQTRDGFHALWFVMYDVTHDRYCYDWNSRSLGNSVGLRQYTISDINLGIWKGDYILKIRITNNSDVLDLNNVDGSLDIPISVHCPTIEGNDGLEPIVSASPIILRDIDINSDGRVNMYDIAFVAIRFMTIPSSPNWDSKTDINKDNIVNMIDISTVAIAFGT